MLKLSIVCSCGCGTKLGEARNTSADRLEGYYVTGHEPEPVEPSLEDKPLSAMTDEETAQVVAKAIKDPTLKDLIIEALQR